ncbi:MAG: 2-hydroxyacyl-CoA dehydratase [Chloroflexi bacterium]|nr:2-hydroxyacyl-CoA dehydratase [Chloroflexota bacterium]
MTESYQGRIHLLQKQVMNRYYKRLTQAAEEGTQPAVYMLVSGNPIELLQAFDMLPVYPEVNCLQIAAKKLVLPYIQKAEEMGYSMDNCAYVKADVGLYFSGLETPFARIPKPSLILCNFVGCNVYLNWFEHLAEYTGAQVFTLDIPFPRDPGQGSRREDVQYVVNQLTELIKVLERMTGRRYDEDRLKQVLKLAGETEDYWSRIKDLTKRVPTPFDAYFDAVTLMAPLYCVRGSEEGLMFFQEAYKELEERARLGISPVEQERFRYVIEGPPPWPYLKTFRDLFTKWGAVSVASTYSTVGGLWEFGFRHDADRPLESIAEHMLAQNYTNSNLLQRYDQIRRYVDEWSADALVIHSVKSCRLFSAGQGDMREYFVRELEVPTLLIESDLEDPRYFSEAQIKNRVDAFFESLGHKRILKSA